MKAVLISIKPKYCRQILFGMKNIEIRKNCPKLKTPFRCYVYCTKGQGGLLMQTLSGNGWESLEGKVIADFICDKVYKVDCDSVGYNFTDGTKGFVVYNEESKKLKTCLTDKELSDYLGIYTGYGWHISKLTMYDKPMRLNELIPSCHHYGDDAGCVLDRKWGCQYQENDYNPDGSVNMVLCSKRVKKAPQSWCYVYEEGC